MYGSSAKSDRAPVGISEFLDPERNNLPGVYLEIIDLEAKFNTLPRTPLLVNEFNIKLKADKDRLNQLMYMAFDGDTLDPLPSCECTLLRSEDRVGETCPNCMTVCLPVTEKDLTSILWIRVPEGVRAFINPQVYLILSNEMNDKIFNTLEYLTSPSYKCPAVSQKMRKVQALNLPRDLNYFIDNFDYILNTLRDAKVLKSKSKSGYFHRFIVDNRKKLFTRYLPVPSKINFITEKTATGRYADLDMGSMLDGIQAINSIEHSPTPISLKVKINRTVKALSSISNYYNEYYRKQLGKKTGWLRKHVFGASLHFSFRGVISGISKAHDKESLELPWSMAVLALNTHLTTLLQREGYSPNQAQLKLSRGTLQYDPDIDRLFKQLIAASPFHTRNWSLPGLPVMFQRNPSLQRGTALSLLVTKILDY